MTSLPRLLAVEATRYRSRRAVAVLLLGVIAITALTTFFALYNTRPLSDADLARAEQRAEQEAQRPYVQRDLARCTKNPERFLGPGNTSDQCAEMMLPQPEWFLSRPQLDVGNVRDGEAAALAVLTTALLMLSAITFAGADWASGSMSNQLLFESRRLRVWGAKAAAVALAVGLTSAVVLGIFWGFISLGVASRDIAVRDGLPALIAWQTLRSVVLAAGAALAGFALTMLLRSTVATLGLMFAYTVAGEIIISLLPFEGAGRLSLGNNVGAWVAGAIRVYDPRIECAPTAKFCNQSYVLSQADGALFLGVFLVLLVAASAWSFRRRDIP